MAVSIVPGLMTLTLIFPLSSAVQVRAKERTAALLALYTLITRKSRYSGNRTIQDDRSAVLHERLSLLHGKQGPANVDIERFVEAFFSNGAEWLTELTIAGASKEDVDMALLLFDRLEQPIEVCKTASIALNAGDILADFFDCFVESFWRRPVRKTYAPSSTNNLAVASAIPLVAPVMTATLFSNFFDMDKDSTLWLKIRLMKYDDRVQRPLEYNYTTNG